MNKQMRIESTQSNLADEVADAIVVGIWNDTPPVGAAAEFDAASGGLLSRLIEAKEISKTRCSVLMLHMTAGIRSPIAVIVSLGDSNSAPACLPYRAAAAAAKSLATHSRNRVTYFLDDLVSEASVAGAMVGCVGQDIRRQEKELYSFQSIAWATDEESLLRNGQAIGESINRTRHLVNMPPNEIFPASFAEECERVGRESGFDVEIWDEDRLRQEKCDALLAVANASERPARLVIMRYMGAGEKGPVLGLVGKGVTFDSGGLSLKPSASMLDMKCDMAGAATVLGAMEAISRLQLSANVVGFAGLAENMIGGRSYRPGDVLRTRNGKTVEVHNTDAEGRLVLADTLDVACQSEVANLIDLATLTGACVVALGPDVAGLMTNNSTWGRTVLSAAAAVGEKVWQLPMHDEYSEYIKSKVADIKNIGDVRCGDAITAAKFLEEFVQGRPWVHLDIAGPSFAAKPSTWVDAGASGCMVHTLVQVARDWQNL